MKKIYGELKSGETNPSPEIDCYIPKSNPKGIGIIIFPGGGYGDLAEHEGKGYAEYFNDYGIAAFVVTYRLGSNGFRHPAMLEDALAAISTVRSRASEFAVDQHKLGIMGSSAGGHLAAHTLVAWDKYKSNISLRPDFGILCYPVIVSEGKYTHEGSIQNLAGINPSPELLQEISCDKHVSTNTPPCFIWHTGEDICVPLENSMLFATALRNSGVPFELHLYTKGGHGLGLNAPFTWGSDCIRWVEDNIKTGCKVITSKPIKPKDL
ncbi:MAG: alpha/beta hydrolase [Spirochaetaceae bacterium]